MSTAKFRVWKTITLGAIKSVEELRLAYEEAGIKMSAGAWDAVERDFRPVEEPTQVCLAKVKLSELCSQFKMSDCASFHMIRRAIGRQFCPPELAPLLRLQYADQPKDEYVYIGMALRFSGGYAYTYVLANRGSELWLDTDSASPGALLGDVEFILVIPDDLLGR